MENRYSLIKAHALRRLSAKGYVCGTEIPLQNGVGQLDVFGFKRNGNKFHKIAVICLNNPTNKEIKEKTKLYKEYVHELIFAFFDDIKYKNTKVKIWKVPKMDVARRMGEYICESCYNTFYADKKNISFCPYCGKNKFTMNFSLERYNEELIRISLDDKNIKSKVVALKNPKFLRNKDGVEYNCIIKSKQRRYDNRSKQNI